MRSSKNRSRSKNRNRPSGGNVVGRVFDSSGPEGKVRGTPQQIIDKYGQLARDAQLAGDRVAVENFQQHAEHYTRMLAEAQKEIDSKREQQDREQQARQDRERAEREARDARDARRGEPQGGHGDAPRAAQQPDMTDPRGDAGPVDVPEAAGAGEVPRADAPPPEERKPRTRRARKPRNDPREESAAPAGDEAAESP